MKSKRIVLFSVALVSSLALVATACNHSDDDSSSDDPIAPRGEPSVVPGFDGTTIKLGFLTDLSGALSVIGGPIRDGSQIYWDYVNEELGGIGGKYKVELVVEDTEDQPNVAVQAYQKIKNDVVMFGEILSTPPVSAILPLLKQDGILAVPGSLAARWVREPNILPQAAPYEYEIINIVDWWHTTESDGSDIYCAVYVDDVYGNSTLDGFDHIVDALELTVGAKVTINRGDTSFATQISTLQDADCTVVVAITVPSEQNTMLGEALQMGFEPTWLGALPAYISLLGGVPAFEPRYANFYYTQDAPPLSDTTVEGVVNFNTRFEAYMREPFSTFNLSGYFLAFAAHQLLEKAVALGDLSREGILTASAQLGEVSVEGLAAENYVYGPADERIPPKASRIMRHELGNGREHIREVAAHTSPHIDTFVLPAATP